MRKKTTTMKPFKPGLRETAREGDVVTLELTLDGEPTKHLRRIARIARLEPEIVARVIVAIEAYKALGDKT